MLDELGLGPAVEWLTGNFSTRHAIPVSLALAQLPEISGECATAIFRILQESLTNVAKHANATAVSVTLCSERGEIDLEVSDNGGGIPMARRNNATLACSAWKSEQSILEARCLSQRSGPWHDRARAVAVASGAARGTRMIELSIADDHTMFREGLKQLLAVANHVSISGEARNGEELLAHLAGRKNDVILLDMTMPGRSGVVLIRESRARYSNARTFVLDTHEEQQFIVEALKAGAHGYVTKNSAPDQLILGIERIAAGEQFVSASASQGIIRQLCSAAELTAARLSYREREVLDLIVAGNSVSAIANALSTSIKIPPARTRRT